MACANRFLKVAKSRQVLALYLTFICAQSLCSSDVIHGANNIYTACLPVFSDQRYVPYYHILANPKSVCDKSNFSDAKMKCLEMWRYKIKSFFRILCPSESCTHTVWHCH